MAVDLLTYLGESGRLEQTRVVLDTNVLLDRHIQAVVETFEEPTVFIVPYIVLKELDKFKKGVESINENAREAGRFLNSLREKSDVMGLYTYDEEKHLFYIHIDEKDLDISKPDNEIIVAAKQFEARLFSQDLNELVVSDALGVESNMFAPEDVDVNALYTGYAFYEAEEEEYELFQEDGIFVEEGLFLDNQLIIVQLPGYGDMEGIYDASYGKILPLDSLYRFKGIEPKFDHSKHEVNEQKFLLHLLSDDKIKFVTGIGPSGCGKTLLTLACGLDQVEQGKFTRMVIMRPLASVGNDIGYLPGDKVEKLKSWMASSYDALDVILEDYVPKDGFSEGFSIDDKVQGLIAEGMLELEAMTYIRGRSLKNQFVVIDDAQNLTRQEAATIITRIGEGSKLVFLGDLSEKQIDNPRLTPRSNGLAYVVDRMKGQEIVGHLTLSNIVRSKLAQLGVDLL